jgi:hypothetical protein
VFQHADSSEMCQQIDKQVEKELLSDTTSSVTVIDSSLELYQIISKTKIHDVSILFDSLIIDRKFQH